MTTVKSKKKDKKTRLQAIEETAIKDLTKTYEMWQKAKIGGIIDKDMIVLLLRKSIVISQYAYIQYMLPLADEEKEIQAFLEQEARVITRQLDRINATLHRINSGIVS